MRRAINSPEFIIRSTTAMAVVLCTAVGVVLLPPSAAELSPRLTAGEMTLVGAEDFTGSWGTPPDPAYWGYDLGGGGWGNNELQMYTSNRDNVRLNGAGLLVIEARRSGNSYSFAPGGYAGQSRFSIRTGRGANQDAGRPGTASRDVDAGIKHHDRRLPGVWRDRHHGAGQYRSGLSQRHPRTGHGNSECEMGAGL